MRPALEAEIRKDAAAEKVYALTQAYDDAHQGGANLADAAAKAGVPVVTLGPLTQSGRDQQGQPVPGLTPEADGDRLVACPPAARARSRTPATASTSPCASTRSSRRPCRRWPRSGRMLAQAWMQRELAKAHAGQGRRARRPGEEGREPGGGGRLRRRHASPSVPGIDRQTASQNPTLSQDMLAKLFTRKPGDVFTAQNSHFGFVVGKLEAIHTGDPADARARSPSRSGRR